MLTAPFILTPRARVINQSCARPATDVGLPWGRIKPAITSNNVDLPVPESPIITTSSPGIISNEKFSQGRVSSRFHPLKVTYILSRRSSEDVSTDISSEPPPQHA